MSGIVIAGVLAYAGFKYIASHHDRRRPTVTWTGIATSTTNETTPLKFENVTIKADGKLKSSGVDQGGKYQLRGQVKPNGQVLIEKLYKANPQESRTYTGLLSGQGRVTGTWTRNTALGSGNFDVDFPYHTLFYLESLQNNTVYRRKLKLGLYHDSKLIYGLGVDEYGAYEVHGRFRKGEIKMKIVYFTKSSIKFELKEELTNQPHCHKKYTGLFKSHSVKMGTATLLSNPSLPIEQAFEPYNPFNAGLPQQQAVNQFAQSQNYQQYQQPVQQPMAYTQQQQYQQQPRPFRVSGGDYQTNPFLDQPYQNAPTMAQPTSFNQPPQHNQQIHYSPLQGRGSITPF